MRKIPLFTLSILMAGAIFSPINPTSAAIEANGTTWWSVEELLEFYAEVEAEKEAECGDNQDCRMEFGFNMIEKGPKYSALSNLIDMQIWVTSVNPEAETVKILYFDDEMMLRRMGIEEKISLEHLFMGWFDDWNGQIYNYDHEQFVNGAKEGLHIMYDASSETDGDDWLPAWREVELSVAGSNLLDNFSGKIDYAVYAKDNMFNAQGYFDYSSCLRHPDYVEGMECKMYVSGDQWVLFFPPRDDSYSNETGEIMPEIIDSTDTNETTSEDTSPSENDGMALEDANPSENDETALEDVKSNEDNETAAPGDIEPTEDDQTMSLTNDSADIDEMDSVTTDNQKLPVKTPETGTYTKTQTEDIEMPWWITTIDIIGVITILWLFIPLRGKKGKSFSQKSLKNSKKTLDKTSGLR